MSRFVGSVDDYKQAGLTKHAGTDISTALTIYNYQKKRYYVSQKHELLHDRSFSATTECSHYIFLSWRQVRSQYWGLQMSLSVKRFTNYERAEEHKTHGAFRGKKVHVYRSRTYYLTKEEVDKVKKHKEQMKLAEQGKIS